MKTIAQIPTVINAIEKVDLKAAANQSVIAPGKNVSLAEQK